MTRAPATVLLAVAAGAAALLLNLVLLDRASGTDRIGRLQPRAHVPAIPAPPGTVRPTGGEEQRGRSDD